MTRAGRRVFGPLLLVTGAVFGAVTFSSDLFASGDTVLNSELASKGSKGGEPFELTEGSVTSFELLDGTIRAVDLADGEITGAKLAPGTLGDLALQSALDQEIADRIADVDAEQLDREAGDNALQTDLNDEIAARAAADVALDTALGDFEAALAAPDSADGVNDGDGLVDWSNVDGVDAKIVSREAADVVCTACVSGTEISDVDGSTIFGDITYATISASNISGGTLDATTIGPGAITGSQLALATDKGGAHGIEAITGNNIEPRSIDADRLALNSLTSDELGAGSVDTDELKAGAVTADKQKSNAQIFTDVNLDPGTLATTDLAAGSTDLPTFSTTILSTEGAPHDVMVTAQAQLSCMCSDPADVATVSYQLVRTDDPDAVAPTYTVISPTYQVEVRNGASTAPISIAFLDRSVPVGDHVYKVRAEMTASAGAPDVVFTQVLVNAVDLGRS